MLLLFQVVHFNGGHENYFRINYSNMPEDRIVDGIKIIGEVIREYI